jgi:hypothetical protein
MDKANACIHMALVKFSPVTFQLALVLKEEWDKIEGDYTVEVIEVLSHIGQYELDLGR